MGPIFVYALLVGTCLVGLARPHVALIGYFGFSLLLPTWNWRWSIAEDAGFQKYLAASCLIGFLMTGLRGNKLRGRAGYAAMALGLYLGISYLSMSQSVDQKMSANFMDIMWKIVLMMVVGIVLLDAPRKFTALLWVAVFAQGYSAFRINEDYFSRGFTFIARDGWGFLDNNTYSIATLPVMAISFALMLTGLRVWQRLLAGTIFIMQAHEIMLLESRGGMIGALVMVALMIYSVPKTRWTVTTLVLGTLVTAALAGPPVMKRFSSSFEGEGERDSSAESRFFLWKAGTKITLDYPLLGVGPNAGSRLVPVYYEGGLNTNEKALHNLFFDITTGSGVPAAVCYFAFLGWGWWAAVRTSCTGLSLVHWLQPVRLAVVGGIPGYLTASMFSSGALIESGYLLAVIGLAASLVARRTVPAGRSRNDPKRFLAAPPIEQPNRPRGSAVPGSRTPPFSVASVAIH